MMQGMARTTITLTPEAESLIRKAMRERGVSFKDAVNDAVVRALSPEGEGRPRYEVPTFALGTRVPLDDVTGLLNQLDDEEFLRKRETGK
jgi:hypothetical protein